MHSFARTVWPWLLLLVPMMATAQQTPADITFRSAEEVRLGKDALERFNTTAKFINRHPDQEALYRALQSECEVDSAKKCMQYLLGHREDVKNALPDNPAYWTAFHDMLEAVPLGADPQYTFSSNHPRSDLSHLIDAMTQWVYRDLALHQRLDSETFIHYYKNLRRLAALSETSLERMVFVAGVGIAHHQMEMLLPLLAAQENRSGIISLREAVRPFDTQERSVRRVFLGEMRYSDTHIDQLDFSGLSAFLNPELMPLGPVNEVRTWLKQESRNQTLKAARIIGEISERSWSDYWRLPPMVTNQEEEGELWVTSPYDFIPYLGTVRSAEAIVYLIQALADVHVGMAPRGLPHRQPPPYWDWSWDADKSAICLAPNELVQGRGDFSKDHPACVTYIDPADVREWLH